MSLFDIESGANLFRDLEGPRGWSKACYGFLAGILRTRRRSRRSRRRR